MPSEQLLWKPQQHEKKVEKFYSHGVQNYGDFHGGYLNFGFWEEGITHYVQAAENLVLRLGKMLRLGEKSRLLDVACGMGAQDVLLHQHFGMNIDAVDVTWPHVQRTRERVTDAKLEPAIKVHHGTATALPFPDKTFTHLLSVEGPEHFHTREKFFSEAYRVLQPGGILVMADYTLKRQPKGFLDCSFIQAFRRLWHVPKENMDTANSYYLKLERQGFSNISLQEVGAQTIPGYYFEEIKPETRKQLAKIRGWFVAYPGMTIISYLVYKAFTRGLLEYVLVRAEKK